MLSAHFDRSRPGGGPLEVAYELRRGARWPDLGRWAAQAAAGRRVLAITGASTSERRPDSLCALLFYEQGQEEQTGGAVEYVEVQPTGSWDGAAEAIMARLHALAVERGQLLSIDAHNDGPDEGALFSAYYCRALPGRGRLALRRRCLNVAAPWQALHRQAAAMASAGEVVAITGSSNTAGRAVMYVFLSEGE